MSDDQRQDDQAAAEEEATEADEQEAVTDKSTDEQLEEQAEASAPQGEADELRSQLLRSRADFENYKRRAEDERSTISQVARTDVILDLLPVIDNFDRAFADVPEDIAKSDWYGGVKAIKQQFEKILGDLGIERIEAVGQEFDPSVHEAVSHEPSDEHDKDVITKEFEAGYRLGDSVIRHARVAVSSGKPDAAGQPDADRNSNDKENES